MPPAAVSLTALPVIETQAGDLFRLTFDQFQFQSTATCHLVTQRETDTGIQCRLTDTAYGRHVHLAKSGRLKLNWSECKPKASPGLECRITGSASQSEPTCARDQFQISHLISSRLLVDKQQKHHPDGLLPGGRRITRNLGCPAVWKGVD